MRPVRDLAGDEKQSTSLRSPNSLMLQSYPRHPPRRHQDVGVKSSLMPNELERGLSEQLAELIAYLKNSTR